jgi:hypothetical protein
MAAPSTPTVAKQAPPRTVTAHMRTRTIMAITIMIMAIHMNIWITLASRVLSEMIRSQRVDRGACSRRQVL